LLPSEESKKGTDRLQIEPQYFASIGREVKVIHESGIVVLVFYFLLYESLHMTFMAVRSRTLDIV
jgi:hypothetical protein